MAHTPSWLETAVFYEIYPQTYFDSNGDGIGDIKGIIQKLDYIQFLGANALWLNPCFLSPFQDAGYDVSDYYQVAPRYGTNADLEALFDEAHRRGMHVFLDLVPGHTSLEHKWFQESASVERNKYSDWYIWTNSVWTWSAPGVIVVTGYSQRDANYITNFFHFQPALNYGFATPDPDRPWEQPVDAPGPRAVRKELKAIMKFWLDRGADGFRVDMAGSLIKRDPDGQATSALWQEMRAWLDRSYPEAALVSEWSRPSVAIPAGFHMDFMLPFARNGYNALFRLHDDEHHNVSFFHPQGRGNIKALLDEFLPNYRATHEQGFICIPSGNHDTTPRLGNERTTADLELAFLFLLTMPGVPFIYYGDEIGMRSPSGLVSKEGGYGRTGARTPMQWDDSVNDGFSTAPADDLYLPVEAKPGKRTVAAQRDDPRSLLNRVRRQIALRQAHPALNAGGLFKVIHAEKDVYPFVYTRTGGGEKLLVALNPSKSPCEVTLPASLSKKMPETLYGKVGVFTQVGKKWALKLPGVSGGVYSLS